MIKLYDRFIKFRPLLLGVTVFLAAYVSQVNLAVPLLLICLWVYARCRGIKCSPLNLTLLFLIGFSCSYFIVKEGLAVSFIPFAIIPMLTCLLFGNLEIVLLMAIAIAFSAGFVAGNSLNLVLLFLVSGIVSGIIIKGARKRITIIRAGILVGVAQAVTLIIMERLHIASPFRYLILLLNGVISSIIVLGVLPVFEYLFKTVTNISLLELADFNHPLLQRMIMEAPGTYHHSLVVGNLSETACNAVGANALLARIGAYYHDIGKLAKPAYFSENQGVKASKHEALSAAMSKLVIMNHVKEGIDLARKYKLNPSLIDFIIQHHGNSLVYYFYRKALEELEEDQNIKEEGFRYPGPKPNTKETAIVLLADSVEAATRALKEPVPNKIEEVVHKVINNKFIDGQLDECDLTLKDLERISAVFIRILSGIYHSRVGYPEEPRSDNNGKKPAKEDSRQSEKDKKGGS